MGAGVPWVMVVVSYARERDVDRQQEDSELDNWTDDLQTFEGSSYESVRTCRWMNCSQAFAQIRRGQPDVAGMVTKSFLSTYLIFQMREGQKVNCVLASMD